MEGKTISISVVEANRPSLTQFGGLFGKRIFKAAKTACITDFASQLEQANNNRGLFVNRNINRYRVVAIDITKIELSKGIEENEYEVVINRDLVDASGASIEVRCPIDDSHFTKKVTEEVLVEALKHDKTSSDVFFSSGKELARFMNAENAKEAARVNKLRADLEKIAQMLDRTSEKNTDYTESYYNQLDGKGKVSAHVHIETED